MATRPDIDAIKARLAVISGSTWRVGGIEDEYDMRRIEVDGKEFDTVAYAEHAWQNEPQRDYNAAFIANAPADVRALLDYIAELEGAILRWHNTANDENVGMDEAVMACDNLAQWVVNDGKA